MQGTGVGGDDASNPCSLHPWSLRNCAYSDTSHRAWEWIFLINIPPGIAVILAARRIIPEARDPLASRRLDLPGMLLSGTGLLALIVAMIEGAHDGWSHPAILGLAIGGLTLLAGFVLWLSGFSEEVWSRTSSLVWSRSARR